MLNRRAWIIALPFISLSALLIIAAYIWFWNRLQLKLEEISPYIQTSELPTIALLLNNILADFLLFCAIFLCIICLALPLIINYGLLPLKEIANAAWQIAESQPLIQGIKDEYKQLSLAINAMAKQQRKRIEALKSERKTLEAVLQYMNDGVIIVDGDGNIKLFNPAAEKIFKVSAERAMQKTLAKTVRYHQIIDLWQQQKRTQEEQITFLEVGTPRIFLQGIAISLEQALPGCTLLIFQDITKLHHLETVRRDFISNISHELRTPLASLKALTETLRSGALEDPKASTRFLLQIEKEVDSLSQMVSELLELSRIESGKVPLKLQDVSPCVLINTAVERLALQAQRENLSITVLCENDLPPVFADPIRIEQVLMNLLHNAIKFTESGGKITLQANQDGNFIVFSIADTGIGIPADDLPRIFERFYKTDPSRRKGGTGLGLAIARKLVEAHHGNIWAESTEGEGSTFYFSLPIA